MSDYNKKLPREQQVRNQNSQKLPERKDQQKIDQTSNKPQQGKNRPGCGC